MTLPTGAAKAKLRLKVTGVDAGDAVDLTVDGAMIWKGTSSGYAADHPTFYFDGRTNSTVWEGAADASSSFRTGTLLDYMLHRLSGIVEGLVVYPERMKENLERMKGLVYSQTLLLALAKAGTTREDAYEIVQRAAMRVWAGEGTFLDMVLEEPVIVGALGRPGVRACFDPRRLLKHVPALMQRVFGPDKTTVSGARRRAARRLPARTTRGRTKRRPTRV